MQHYTIIVSGKVQGVFYRKSALQKAKQFGLNGFVRNETDRSVYIEVEGEEQQLQKFVEWCGQGPERAMVSEVDVNEGELKHYSVFEIRR